MLKNDPPPGTRVRFVQDVGKAKAYSTATLVGPVKHYVQDRPYDEFRVRFRDGQMLVYRQDIAEAESKGFEPA